MQCLLFLSFVLFLVLLYAESLGIKEEFQWSRISYQWKPRHKGGRYSRYGDRDRYPARPENNGAPSNVNYIYENNIPMGANLWKNKLFITVPRRRFGVPSTLNYVNLNSPDRHNVPLIPYPNWEMNQLDYGGEERLVSVYRVAIDPCDRLWMVDSGLIEQPGNRTIIQPQALVIIDLNTDSVIRRFTIPSSFIRPNTNLASLVVDVTADTCDDAYAYIPDLGGYQMIVYSLQQNQAWQVRHNYFYLEPLRGEFFVGGVNFQWNDGIFSIALSAADDEGFRTAYFHSMAGSNMYSVSTKILRNRDLATRSYHGSDFNFLGDRGDGSQTSAAAIHRSSGAYFLGLVNQNALGCWNINKPFKKENFEIIQRDNKKMIYPCDVKVAEDKVILLTNSMPVFLFSRLNYDEVNFRVWISPVKEAVKGTRCAVRSYD